MLHLRLVLDLAFPLKLPIFHIKDIVYVMLYSNSVFYKDTILKYTKM